MQDNLKFMGSAKVGGKLRVSIVKDVADEMGIKDGDHLLYFKDEKGQFIIKKG